MPGNKMLTTFFPEFFESARIISKSILIVGHGVKQKPSETYGDGWDSTQPIFGYASTYRADFTGEPILPRDHSYIT